MPLVRLKRQSPSTQCSTGYQFYACDGVVDGRGCCALDACRSGCPEDALPSDNPFRLIQLVTLIQPSPARSTSSALSTSAPTTTAVAIVTTSMLSRSPTQLADVSTVATKQQPYTEKNDVPAIIGATLGAVGIVALVFLIFFCYRKRRGKETQIATQNPSLGVRSVKVSKAFEEVAAPSYPVGAQSSVGDQKKLRPDSSNGGGEGDNDCTSHMSELLGTTPQLQPRGPCYELRDSSRSPSAPTSPNAPYQLNSPYSSQHDPHTGVARSSRATGSFFISAQGAITSPTAGMNTQNG